MLEIGAGAGRFTQILAGLGAQVLVADPSPGQLALNRQFARAHGFAQAVPAWQQADICDLSYFGPDTFDAVVACGGPFRAPTVREGLSLSCISPPSVHLVAARQADRRIYIRWMPEEVCAGVSKNPPVQSGL